MSFSTDSKQLKELRASIKKKQALIKRNILQLNNKMPESVASFWVTTEEMHDRLIHAGVSRLLRLDHVKDAVKRFNTNGIFLAVHTQSNTQYYRSQRHHAKDEGTVAIDQRYKPITPKKMSKAASIIPKSTSPKARLSIKPERDYFKGESIPEFESINMALENLEDMENKVKQIEDQERADNEKELCGLCESMLYLYHQLLSNEQSSHVCVYKYSNRFNRQSIFSNAFHSRQYT